MLKHLQSHQEYLDLQSTLRQSVPLETLQEYSEVIAMFQLLNFDPAHDFLASLYSPTGRPVRAQIQILRSYLFCAHEHILVGKTTLSSPSSERVPLDNLSET